MGEPGSPISPFSLGGVPPGGMDGYREHKLSERSVGKPGFPTPPPAGRPRPQAGGWGNPVSPSPARGKASPSSRGLGKPGFPRPSPGGRGWEGVALSKGVGKPGFPAPLPRRGLGKPGFPRPSPGGRGWEGVALSRGVGKPGFPIRYPRVSTPPATTPPDPRSTP